MYSLPVTQEVIRGNHNMLYALAQPSKFPWINRLLSWYRLRPGMGILWTDKSLFSEWKGLYSLCNSFAY